LQINWADEEEITTSWRLSPKKEQKDEDLPFKFLRNFPKLTLHLTKKIAMLH
jgi:hypothetical protein